MNDSFSGQNYVAYYQAPNTQAAPADPALPATQPMTEPASMGSPVVTPVGDHMVSGAMPMGNGAPSQMPAEPPVPKPSDFPAATASTVGAPAANSVPNQTDVPDQSEVDDILRKLASRIESYKAANPTSNPAGETNAAVGTMPPASPAPASSASAPSMTAAPDAPAVGAIDVSAEALDAQNIFDLLGVMDGSDAEKETFLDELQQVIWEDFLENDVQLLLTRAEMTELHGLLEQVGKSDAERQEMAVSFLEKLVPDLENIMLEKALELKKEMVFERVAGLRELHSGKTDVLSKISEAELAFKQEKWSSGAKILNSLT